MAGKSSTCRLESTVIKTRKSNRPTQSKEEGLAKAGSEGRAHTAQNVGLYWKRETRTVIVGH